MFDEYVTIAPGKECRFYEDDMDVFNSSDVIIMKGESMFRDATLPNYRPPGQTRIYYEWESPVNIHTDRYYKDWDNFNYTMTYSPMSDIFFPFGFCVPRNDGNNMINLTIIDTFFKTKNKSILWLVSHCISKSLRESYVYELMKYIPIDVHGSCGNVTCEKNRNLRCSDIYEPYKFYLAFENSVCDDYISEKLWRCFDKNVIPVVYGAKASYKQTLPTNSYIDATLFSSPKLLADYLWKVNSNYTLYSSYFLWRKHFSCLFSVGDTSVISRRVCDYLYENKYKTRSANVSQFLEGQLSNCENPSEYLLKMGIENTSNTPFSNEN